MVDRNDQRMAGWLLFGRPAERGGRDRGRAAGWV